ncbi:KN motif and ankyrin repeat domain-containing protein 4 [Poeciliopsis prolifica]|uniref:KN motif and ankyrin repeat domain-containing protein 4 n=1 Tax=Poeciliopsis prolifica TaxID=188132 RepID=UPI00241334B3|nr:KN motif and ankyrin repeat domain-containing protein 4 [Poeciliopsis prolifica]XP_054909584.1 KN motif and ankyrin repeat domain-containing protein 4 [Poeciliopsis prolifica]XP_054909587.1 KN motif and ankyrin repeat domain-containing protein 4 [Poeciliopsis prolifica]XP_054909598.1 KN motif and ankyrin repeat domain-containing protein 4 [Poeciliopsis prolifica]XP_054909606.1 KN motif and ankyrin repeat domain-containing protein 4 [Poeciliopsis prolifica]
MMDKKSANGFQTKVNEGGVQRKQLPYSVETPYGFHLDLDFLKYVDDIEKGNTIKRVHIQRRVKGPAKFSTLPRNFSLPGHGVRPPPKEGAWSGTSTLGPKPKSRVTEVQQIFDFRPSEGAMSSHSKRATTSQGTANVSNKSKDEPGTICQGTEDKTAVIQSRPNLLRASSMPITLQQRKGSDSSSPDRTTGTPENGSTENMFRASPDILERRCLPQDRAGLHQQITVALKRVRELEEQVKTIPELKAQICSLREEREKLLRQIQTQSQVQASTSSSAMSTTYETGGNSQRQRPRPSEGLNLSLAIQPVRGVISEQVPVNVEESHRETDRAKDLPIQRNPFTNKKQSVPSEKADKQKETSKSLQDNAEERLSQDTEVVVGESEIIRDSNASKEDQNGMLKLEEKLMMLEAKLTQASQELERTNALLKEQMEENKAKEDRILQLSEGMRVEICTTQVPERPRRESIDAGTVTERTDLSHQETETESPAKIDQGTDTDKILVEVIVPKPRAASIDRGIATSKLDTHDQQTEMEEEVIAAIQPRLRANSMERGTITESIITQDQTTETPAAERVNQVTETDGETVTDHPQRPRASSIDQGTETERVNTMDRVTETEAAQRSDQQTETEIERREDNILSRDAQAEGRVGESETVVRGDIGHPVNSTAESEKVQIESENVAVEIAANISVTDIEGSVVQTLDSEVVKKTKVCPSPTSGTDNREVTSAQDDSKPKELQLSTGEETIAPKTTEMETAENEDKEIVCETVKENVVPDTVVVISENSAVKAVPPVRPQRRRKTSAEQMQPTSPQPQLAPILTSRESSEPESEKITTKVQTAPCQEAELSAQPSEPQTNDQMPSVPQVHDRSQADKLPDELIEKQSNVQPQDESQSVSSSSSETQIKTKPIQPHSKSQPTSRRDSKEQKASPRGSSASHPPSRESRETKTHQIRHGSVDTQSHSQSLRRSSAETPSSQKDARQTQSLRRGSSEAAQRRGSSEAKALRRESGESQTARRGSGETPTSPAALGQVVTRITGLLGEQWAQLGSSSGAQQTASQQESPIAPKQTATKRVEAGKGTPAKPAGKGAPAATTGKAAGKSSASKMSSIQSQLVSSLSVLSAFYSPGQKTAATSKQQEQGLKSIMKKNGVADKQGSKGAKKNLKFVGVNGGYETTSSEDSSGDEKSRVEVEEEDKFEVVVEKETDKKSEESVLGADAEFAVAAVATAAAEEEEEEEEEEKGAVGEEKEVERGLLDLEGGHELLQVDEFEREKVDKGFIDACAYVKDRMEEVSSPDKEMRQVLVVLYQEWFRVSSQKDSQADTVRLYLRQVGLTTPTLLPYVVNLTDGNGNMALHYSVSHSNFPVVKLLLDTGLCETDNVNKAGYTPVMLAALTAAESPDDLEVAEQLLKLGDVNARSRQAGQTALMLAVSHGRVAMVKLLLSCGADVNAQDSEGSTALMCASEHGHTHIASLLLETGRCDSGLKDKNGQTALSVAEAAAHQDIIDLLKSHASEPMSAADL